MRDGLYYQPGTCAATWPRADIANEVKMSYILPVAVSAHGAPSSRLLALQRMSFSFPRAGASPRSRHTWLHACLSDIFISVRRQKLVFRADEEVVPAAVDDDSSFGSRHAYRCFCFKILSRDGFLMVSLMRDVADVSTMAFSPLCFAD